MAGKDITVIGSGDIEDRVRRELDHPLGAERQRKYRRFVLAAMGSIPWVGSFIAAGAAVDAEREQQHVNELQQEWLEEHRGKLNDLKKTLLRFCKGLSRWERRSMSGSKAKSIWAW